MEKFIPKQKSLFGPYRSWVDVSVHILLSFVVSLCGIVFGFFGFGTMFLLVFLVGLLLDLDHIFNRPLALLFKIPSYEHYSVTGSYGSNGYTIKILHGIDIALIIGLLIYVLSGRMDIAVILAINLCVHELWDFLVYPHSWKELLLVTRGLHRFCVGERTNLVGLFFDKQSLNY